MAKSTKEAKGDKVLEIPLLEWVSAAVGLVIVLGMFGFLAVDAMRSDSGMPPIMRVEPVRLTVASGQYVLQVNVSNSSRKAGAGVQISGELKRGGASIESSAATLSYVPGQSQRRAGLVFRHDPRRFELDRRVTGYERP